MDVRTVLALMHQYIDFSQFSLQFALFVICLAPLIWNVLARMEYRTHILTKWVGMGNRHVACYGLALYIFSFSSFRDYSMAKAMEDQPRADVLGSETVQFVAKILFGAGSILSLASFFRLGITGTYLGDYFGILMEGMVTGFPFNVTPHPMYHGSVMTHGAYALWNRSPCGLMLVVCLFVCYEVACVFEGSFTTMIYAEKFKRDKKLHTRKETRKDK
eukprot:TRINITY_DN20216_c0_g1_i1.p2 TRINITY_DN20216_c0_g1~~TRINITY_DN20216_c0_g1_i1.p2  ORF type:complete len:217 (+),score=23.32 TRINITY_DN20216_c0_g1_i1:194-844(+)